MPDGAYPFIQARFFTPANRSPEDIMYIVIHDMEVDEDSLTSAEGVGNFFSGPNAPRGSTQYGIDQDSIVQYVEDHDVAWGAPNVNHNGLHFEHAGYARQSREEWLDEVSLKILKRSAPLTRRKADECGIELKHLNDDELRSGNVKGFIGHLDATRVLGGGDHWDPGYDFPWDVYMDLVINGDITQAPAQSPAQPIKKVGDDNMNYVQAVIAVKFLYETYQGNPSRADIAKELTKITEFAKKGDVDGMNHHVLEIAVALAGG